MDRLIAALCIVGFIAAWIVCGVAITDRASLVGYESAELAGSTTDGEMP